MEAELIRFKAKSIDERDLLFPPGSWVFGHRRLHLALILCYSVAD